MEGRQLFEVGDRASLAEEVLSTVGGAVGEGRPTRWRGGGRGGFVAHQVARDRGGDGADEADAQEHQGHGGDAALGGVRDDVAVADGGQGDDANV